MSRKVTITCRSTHYMSVVFYNHLRMLGGTWQRVRLRHCATSRKVVALISDVGL
jgi:hypothetical protein